MGQSQSTNLAGVAVFDSSAEFELSAEEKTSRWRLVGDLCLSLLVVDGLMTRCDTKGKELGSSESVAKS